MSLEQILQPEPMLLAPIKISTVFPNLTPRQCEVCALLIQGETNKEIGRELHISHRTVEDHRLSIYRSTGLDTVQAIAYRVMGEPTIVP